MKFWLGSDNVLPTQGAVVDEYGVMISRRKPNNFEENPAVMPLRPPDSEPDWAVV
jgi:hypothetical protein